MVEQAFELLSRGQVPEAIESFSRSLLSGPREVKNYRGRAMAYFQLRKWKLAVYDFRIATELDGKDPTNWLGLALSLAMDNRIYEAIDVYNALLIREPRFTRGHIQLALLYYRLGVVVKGHQQLDAALDSGPSLAERKQIENLKKEQLDLDKKRYYRPDFEALSKQNKADSVSLLKGIKDLFNRHSNI